MSKNRKDAIIIILVTNAILISFIESFFPLPIPIPGVKLGLGNIITMVGIVFLGLKDILLIVVVRSFVVAVLTRGVTMLPFSLSGGILSALIMWVLYKKFSQLFSIKIISIIGAIIHSTAQVMVASMMLGQLIVLYYLPALFITSIVSGFITGRIGELVINEIRNKEIFTAKKIIV
ncbi:Gx transporter family protein [Neobacillus sp. YIM B02564]|uniref:Gx transporter family protein n=1 Tax=Neobacillus paridis TaxID=2803862 RepID=A0ABS1TRJ0_9BACI|nr:Gx transporter family protein [Neobacillus paridis]MBL4953931.1 Gx transporter family protein [Neobacillus paridis]